MLWNELPIVIGIVIFSVMAYFIGSIPTGYWLGKHIYHVDVRKQGSGNLGATNVFRVLGWKAGLATLIIDILKGYLPIQMVSWLFLMKLDNPTIPGFRLITLHPWWHHDLRPAFGDYQSLHYMAWPYIYYLLFSIGLSTILGHTFSCFVGFKGGKGVATSLGVFLALLPIPSLIALITFIVLFSLTRYVSVGSLAGAVALAVSAFLTKAPHLLEWFSLAVTLFVGWTHRANVKRLIAGSENRLSWSK